MKSPGKNNEKGKDTSWGSVADWYEEYLSGDDTYHAKVIAPNLLRILNPERGLKVLDLGCGEGYFTRLIKHAEADVVGADIAAELIQKAKNESPEIPYFIANAEDLSFAKDKVFDAITCVLALQNMQDLEKVLLECARVLKKNGRLIFVLNHPAFRIPKRSSWGWDEKEKIQYRRLDGYLSMSREKIDMSPGRGSENVTWSFHRSLQDYMKALAGGNFAITKIEEWISHKKSEKGARSEAEDTARKEFPLFMAIETRLM
jgi:ubiquinone/menaquinone biosynthesis C-methylase UbiE